MYNAYTRCNTRKKLKGETEMLRTIVSFVLLVAAAITLITFFMSASTIIFDPFRAAFNPFDFRALGDALFGFMTAISIPLIMLMLALIGLAVGRDRN